MTALASPSLNGTAASYALTYRRGGLSPLPIRKGKRPDGRYLPVLPDKKGELRATWKPFQTEAETEAKISKWKSIGVGIVCGKISGNLEVIDFDDTDLVQPYLERVEHIAPGLLERLPQVRTPRDGLHIYLRCATIEKNQALAQEVIPEVVKDGEVVEKEKTVALIETRGEGGYVVAPGSAGAVHHTGKTYEHIAGPQIVATPEITPDERDILFSVARSFCRLPVTPDEPERTKNKGNNVTFEKLPGHIFNERGDWSEILTGWTRVTTNGQGTLWRRPGSKNFCSARTGHYASDLLHVFTTNAAPLEAGKSYDKFGAYTLLNHGGDFSAAAKDLAARGFCGTRNNITSYTGPVGDFDNSVNEAPNYFVDNVNEAPADDWPDPIPLTRFERPEFPIDALPDDVQGYLLNVAASKQVSIDLVAACFLPAVATCVHGRLRVHVAGSWFEPTNIYAAALEPPAARKSQVHNEITAPHEKWEREQAERLAPDIERNRLERDFLDKKVKKMTQSALSEKDDDRLEELRKEIADVAAQRDAVEEIVAPRIKADDVTNQKFVSLLATHGGRMGVFSTEGGPFKNMTTSYSREAANFDVYLKAHPGDTIIVDRIGRPSEHVPHPAATISVCIQPRIMQRILARDDLRDSGLLARFLYFWPESKIGKRQFSEKDIDGVFRSAYHEAIYRLLGLQPTEDRCGNPNATVVRLDTEARNVFRQFAERTERDLSGDMQHIQDWGGKLAGAVARIAGLLHAWQFVDVGIVTESEIDARTMRKTIEIGDYLKAHALAVFGTSNPNLELAVDLLEWLPEFMRSESKDTFTKRDAFNKFRGRSHVSQADDIDPALKLLTDYGWVRPTGHESRPGRPTEKYHLHSKAMNEGFAHFADGVLE